MTPTQEVLISMKSDLVVKKGWLVGDGLMNDDAPKEFKKE